MKIIKNNIIPIKGFAAMAFFPFLFIRQDWLDNLRYGENSPTYKTMLNHEKIHFQQQKEMLFILYYIWYVIEWLVRLFINGPSKAYSHISFEQEAYDNEKDGNYLKNRELFSWNSYLIR